MQMMRVEFFLPAHLESAIDTLGEYLTSAYGGVTVRDAHGVWRNGLGDFVAEEVVVVLAFCEDTAENRLHIETLAREFLQTTSEECVLYVINGNDVNFVKE
jgi:hypothetical protein